MPVYVYVFMWMYECVFGCLCICMYKPMYMSVYECIHIPYFPWFGLLGNIPVCCCRRKIDTHNSSLRPVDMYVCLRVYVYMFERGLISMVLTCYAMLC